jgi:predicted O-methyltransferase YrrM
LRILNGDIREATEENLDKKVNTIFYDADHELNVQRSCLNHILQYTENEFILVVDDANLDGVLTSTKDFIEENKITVLYERSILTGEIEDTNSWWNGINIFVLKK